MSGLVLVTGATGFIGRHLVLNLVAEGWRVRAAARDPSAIPMSRDIEPVALPDLRHGIDWEPLLKDVTAVVHLAGIAHATAAIPEADYMAVNADATAALARAAARSFVKRVVFVSSMRAQSGPSSNEILAEEDPPRPTDAYGLSKLWAEQALATALAHTSTEWVVLRPVLVYGPSVKGNMRSLFRLARSRMPLPIGSLPGMRSILSLDNLSSAVRHVLVSGKVANQTYLVADHAPLTVAQIVTHLRAGLGRRPGIISVPLAPVRIGLGLFGKENAWERLSGDLIVDIAALKATGWLPPRASSEALAAAIVKDVPR